MVKNFSSSDSRVVIYVARRDLRVVGNAILLEAKTRANSATRLLPVFVFSTERMDVSGLIAPRVLTANRYPVAVRRFGSTQLWPCGPHQAAFVAESVWAFREKLQVQGSDLVLRVGCVAGVVQQMVRSLGPHVAVWMAEATGQLEQKEEAEVRAICAQSKVPFRLFEERTHMTDPLTPFQGMPSGPLPPLPRFSQIPAQEAPFVVPSNVGALVAGLQRPIQPTLQRLQWEWTSRLAHSMLEGSLSTSMAPGYRDAMQRPWGGELEARRAVRQLVLAESTRTRGAQAVATAIPAAPLSPALFSVSVGAYLTQGCTTAAIIRGVVAEKEMEQNGNGNDNGCNPANVVGLDVRYQLLQRDYARRCFSALGEAAVQSNSQRERMRKESYGLQKEMVRYQGDDDDCEAVQRVLDQLVRADTGLNILDQALRDVLRYGVTRVEDAPALAARFLFQRKGVCWTHAARFFTSWLVDGDEALVWTTCKHAATSKAGRALDPDLDGSYLRTFLPGAVPEETNKWLQKIQTLGRSIHERAGYYRHASGLVVSGRNSQANQQTAVSANPTAAPNVTPARILDAARVPRVPGTTTQRSVWVAVSSTNANLNCIRHRMRTVWPARPEQGLARQLLQGRCSRQQAPTNSFWYRSEQEAVLSVIARAMEEVLLLTLPTHELVRVTVNSSPGFVDGHGLDSRTETEISKVYAKQYMPEVSTASAAWKAGWLMAGSSIALQAEAAAAAAASSPLNSPTPSETEVPELTPPSSSLSPSPSPSPSPSARPCFSTCSSNPSVPSPAETELVPGTVVDQMYVYMPPEGQQYMGNASPARVDFFWSFRRGLLARYAAERETVRLRTEAARIRNLGCQAPLAVTTCTPGAVPQGLQALMQSMAGQPICFASTWTERIGEHLARALPPTWVPCLDGQPAVHVFLPLGNSQLDRILRHVAVSVTWEGDDMDGWDGDWEGPPQRIIPSSSRHPMVINEFDQVASFYAQLPASVTAEWNSMHGRDGNGSACMRAFGLPESEAPGPVLRIELWHDSALLWAGLAHKGPMPLYMSTEDLFFLSPAFHAVVDKAFAEVGGDVREERSLETAAEEVAAMMEAEGAREARGEEPTSA